MSVKIRMTRMGRRHRPFFRINAVESTTPRDGRILEKLGHYDPIEKNAEKQIGAGSGTCQVLDEPGCGTQ